MVQVTQSPLFANNFPLNTTPLANRRVKNELADDLIGAAAGANTAVVTRARLKGETPSEAGGGRRTLETVTDINRTTTAADVTALKADVIKSAGSLTFPRDLSGNGGPAFVRT